MSPSVAHIKKTYQLLITRGAGGMGRGEVRHASQGSWGADLGSSLAYSTVQANLLTSVS